MTRQLARLAGQSAAWTSPCRLFLRYFSALTNYTGIPKYATLHTGSAHGPHSILFFFLATSFRTGTYSLPTHPADAFLLCLPTTTIATTTIPATRLSFVPLPPSHFFPLFCLLVFYCLFSFLPYPFFVLFLCSSFCGQSSVSSQLCFLSSRRLYLLT